MGNDLRKQSWNPQSTKDHFIASLAFGLTTAFKEIYSDSPLWSPCLNC